MCILLCHTERSFMSDLLKMSRNSRLKTQIRLSVSLASLFFFLLTFLGKVTVKHHGKEVICLLHSLVEIAYAAHNPDPEAEQADVPDACLCPDMTPSSPMTPFIEPDLSPLPESV